MSSFLEPLQIDIYNIFANQSNKDNSPRQLSVRRRQTDIVFWNIAYELNSLEITRVSSFVVLGIIK